MDRPARSAQIPDFGGAGTGRACDHWAGVSGLFSVDSDYASDVKYVIDNSAAELSILVDHLRPFLSRSMSLQMMNVNPKLYNLVTDTTFERLLDV